MHTNPLPDACPPNPKRRWRTIASLPIIVSTVLAGCILFLLFIVLILHATAVPTIHVDSGSYLSLSHEVNTTPIIVHGDFLFRIKNPSPFVSIKHMHVKLNVYYNYQLVSSNVPIDSFIVQRLKEVTFTSSTNSTASLEMPNWKGVTVGIEFEAKRRLGIIGDWWIFAFTLYASCDDMVFRRSSDSDCWKWTPLGSKECSIDSFLDYV